VQQGIPFREAHEQVGRLVRRAEAGGIGLAALPDDVVRELAPDLDHAALAAALDARRSVARRAAVGGTAPEAVRAQLRELKERVGRPSSPVAV
jgi:argininosuccinate lyase